MEKNIKIPTCVSKFPVRLIPNTGIPTIKFTTLSDDVKIIPLNMDINNLDFKI